MLFDFDKSAFCMSWIILLITLFFLLLILFWSILFWFIILFSLIFVEGFFLSSLFILCGFYHFGIRASFLRLWGPDTKAAMEKQVEELERRLEDVVLLLSDQQQVWPKGHFPPRRANHRVAMEDQWDGCSRGVRGHQHSLPLPSWGVTLPPFPRWAFAPSGWLFLGKSTTGFFTREPHCKVSYPQPENGATHFYWQ